MRIVNLAMNYMQGWNYQDNLLPKAIAEEGHEAIVIAPNRVYRFFRAAQQAEPELCSNPDCMDGMVRIIRMPIKKYGKRFYTMPGLYNTLDALKPDILLVHGPQQLPLITAVKYAKKHPEIKFFIDNHADFNNSAHGFISKYLLHGIIYRLLFKLAYNRVDKIFYLSFESKQLMLKLYKAPIGKLVFFPLGGTLIEKEEKSLNRKKKRKELNLSEDDLMIVHSGKFDSLKRTSELLQAFSRVPSDNMRLVLLGYLSEEIEENIKNLVSMDKRILFLGWKGGDELLEYLCACDLYCQPGSQSATLQNAICCGAPIMIYPHISYEPFLKNNGWTVETISDMEKVFAEIAKSSDILNDMSESSYGLARELLDYKKIASKLYD